VTPMLRLTLGLVLSILLIACGPADRASMSSAGGKADPVQTLASAEISGGVTAASLSGGTLTTCEGGAAKSRLLSDFASASDAGGDCPTPTAGQAELDGRTVEALGTRGLSWTGGGSVNTRRPAYDVAFPTSDKRFVVTASWDRVLLWDLDAENGPALMATEQAGIVGVTGITSDGEGAVFAWGPGGVAHLNVDPSVQAPDIKLGSTRLIMPRVNDDGTDASRFVLRSVGPPLVIRSVTSEGPFDVTPEWYGEGELPEGAVGIVDDFDTLLVEVTLRAGQPAGMIEGAVIIKSDDPDEPTVRVPVLAGRSPLKVGDPAPPYDLPDMDGVRHTLADVRGKVVHLKLFSAL
jgi:hypothetical protein